MDVNVYTLLTAALGEGEWSASRFDRFIPSPPLPYLRKDYYDFYWV